MYQDTLAVSRGAEGTLQEQASIYAESWKAARDNVKASLEGVYDSLINEDFFISIDKGISKFLNGLETVIDAVGGLSGVLNIASYAMLSLYGDRMAQGIRNTVSNLEILTGLEDKRNLALKEQAINAANVLRTENSVYGAQVDAMKKRNLLELELLRNGDRINDINKQRISQEITIFDVMQDQYVEMVKQQELLNKKTQGIENKYARGRRVPLSEEEILIGKTTSSLQGTEADSKKYLSNLARAYQEYNNQLTANEAISKAKTYIQIQEEKYLKSLKEESRLLGLLDRAYEVVEGQIRESGYELDEVQKKLRIIYDILRNNNVELNLDSENLNIDDFLREIDRRREDMDLTSVTLEPPTAMSDRFREDSLAMADAMEEIGRASIDTGMALEENSRRFNELNDDIVNGRNNAIDYADAIIMTAQRISMALMAAQTLSSSISMLFDDDLSGGEKFLTVMTQLSMLLPLVANSASILSDAQRVLQLNTATANAGLVAQSSLMGLIQSAALRATPAIAAFGATLSTVLLPLSAIAAIATVVIGAVTGIKNAIEQQQQDKIEAQQASIDATKEEISSQNELITTYETLLQTFQETGEGKTELEKATLDMAEALGLEGAEVANLTGNYDQLNEKLKETKKELLDRELLNTSLQQDLYADQLVNSLKESEDIKRLYRSGSESQYQALADSDFAQKYGTITTDFVDLKNLSNIDVKNPREVAEFYELAAKAVEEMRIAMEGTNEEESKALVSLEKKLYALRESYNAFTETQKATESLAFEDVLYKAGETDNISSYEQYIQYYQKLNQLVQDKIALDQIDKKNIESLIETYALGNEDIKKFYLQQQVSSSLSEKFGSAIKDDGSALSDIDEQTLAIALEIIPESSSLQEFENTLQQVIFDASVAASETSMKTVSSILKNSGDGFKLSEDDYEALQSDTEFMKQIEEDFEDFADFQRQAFERQVEYVRDYYTEISKITIDNLQNQEALKREELDREREKLLTLQNLNKETLEKLSDLRARYARAATEEEKRIILKEWNNLQKSLNFKFNISDPNETIDGITTNMERISQKIDEISQKQIDIAVDWSDFDELLQQFNNLQKFASVMKDEAYQVGKSYQYPINEIREWMSVYPELFANATTTTEGLIQLNVAEVDSFIEGKKAETNANADSKIQQWELQKQDLQIKKESLQAELEAVVAAENGKIDAQELSSEQKADLIQRLTEYFIEAGMNEVEANAKALSAMSIDEKEYSRIVAEVAKTNADNMARSSAEGAKATQNNLRNSSQDWVAYSKTVALAVVAAVTGVPVNIGSGMVGRFTFGSNFSPSVASGKFGGSKIGKTPELKDFQADVIKKIEADLSAIDRAIANIDAKILAAKNLQLTKPEIGGSKPPKGGGGKKKGGSEKEPTEEELKQILERYHEITKEIEYQQMILSEVQTQIDRVYGYKKILQFKKEQEELNKLLDLQSQKAKAALAFVESDRQSIKDFGLNPIIDSDSLIMTNYTALLEQITDLYNKEMERFNKMTAEQQEAHKDQMENIKEEYDAKIAALESYEDSVAIYQEQMENVENIIRQIADNELREISYKLEVALDLKKAKDDLLAFSKQIAEAVGDSLVHGIKVADLSYEQAERDIAFLQTLKGNYEEIVNKLNNADRYTNVEELKEQLKNIESQAISTGQALLSFIDSLDKMLPDALQDARKNFEIFTKSLEHNETILGTIKEMLVLQGLTFKTAEGFKQLQDLYDQRMDVALSKSKLQKEYYENSKDALEQAQQALDNATYGTKEYDILKANRDALLEEYQNAQQAMLQASKQAMEIAREMFVTEIDRAAREFEEAITGGISFDLLQTKYDNFIDTEERWLDTVNRVYEVNSYNNKLQQDIDALTSKVGKEKLKALQEEMKLRAEDNKLSKYDIDIMNAKYEMTLKQIALEEAQNNKSQVRLRRNAAGNWSYVYTADEDAVSQANQDYMDAANDYYNIAKDQVKDVSGQIIDTWKEMNEKLKEVYKDEALTTAEREAAIAEIRQYYAQKIADLEELKSEAIKDMNQGIVDSVTASGGTQQDIMDAVEENYSGNLDDMSTSSEDFEEAFNDMCDSMKDAFDDYKDKVEEVAEDVDVALGSDGLQGTLDEVAESTDELTDRGRDAVEQMWDSLSAIQAQSEYYAELADSILEVVKAYEKLGQNAVDKIEQTSKAGYYDKDTDYFSLISAYLMSGGKVGDEIYNELMQQRENKIEGENLDPAKYEEAKEWFEAFGRGEIGDWIGKINISASKYIDKLEEILRKLGITSSFDTGGYTGDFNEGKLAFLHEKELVLNKTDTKNMLDTVQVLRSSKITGIISQLDNILSSSINSLFDSRGFSLEKTGIAENLPIEQNIVINADFPNVSEYQEIVEAFDSLLLTASQYTNRK